MRTARKPPRRPRSLACSKVIDTDFDDDIDIPPDPKSSTSNANSLRIMADRPMRCLLLDIDHMKLATQMTSHPAGRGTALLLQALRQQISIASSDEYTKSALEWIAKHDLLMLKMKKNSVFSRVMQADGVESREEMSRLINTMASFMRGRQYFCAHLKLFLPCVIAILRGRRLPSTTHDQLIACLQKMSVRTAVQREMLNFGMLEWIINFLEQRHSAYAVEYAIGIAINLMQNPFSHPLQLRFADSIAAAVVNVLSRDIHGPSCVLMNSLVFSALGCSRVKLRARETKLLDAVKSRVGKRACSHCDLHIPYLSAIITGDIDIVKVPQSPCDNDSDTAGDSCEREVDSTDPLRPSSNELSGARLLLRRAARDSPTEEPGVPGLVPRHAISPVRTTHGASRATSATSASTQARMGTATSQHTFIIETERRRPLLLPVGLSEYAIEHKKALDAAEKIRKEEELRLQKEREREEKEKERMKSRQTQTTARKPPARYKKFNSKDNLTCARAVERSKAPLRTASLNRKNSDISNVVTSLGVDLDSRSETNNTQKEQEKAIEEINADDYAAVFGARPKVARTPDAMHNSHSFF